MEQVDQLISGMDAEKLRKRIHNYARQAPEERKQLLLNFRKKTRFATQKKWIE
ncbi:hypothetical protein NE619_05130 [Anaerovorax odorimutans]|uniref:Uncharacterized protein n=1 Tax=Anaerovorax odorimutans TaxID=109327 RepID=A0ABT1RLQ4_9FIRM|nr:hypothetical protein [Anaerovorax odorimutans]